jgi:hypothetical protein
MKMSKPDWFMVPWFDPREKGHSSRTQRRVNKRVLAKGKESTRIEESVPPFEIANPTFGKVLKRHYNL